MHAFLDEVQPFTRTVRIIIAAWRWIEAAKPRRAEVGVEEAMAFIGNHSFRILARMFVDWFGLTFVVPSIVYAIDNGWVANDAQAWHASIVFVVLGTLRSLAPFAASFQGSWFGRMLTKATWNAYGDRWRPIMRINDLNMNSDDCCEPDEASANADLIIIAKKVAVVLGKFPDNAVDDDREHLKAAAMDAIGFRQVGSGSGGYATYFYELNDLILLLHVAPYGPSVVDEMPKYIVLEREKAIDSRAEWSDYLTTVQFTGPLAVEGYCYKGAFFSPYQFGALKQRYDEQLKLYEKSCRMMCTIHNAHIDLPPTDWRSLQTFLAMGETRWKKHKDAQKKKSTDRLVTKLAERIKRLKEARYQSENHCKAPYGVIVYLEGLDCSGKSSTSGLVISALEKAGYLVETRRHNRPPTAEQKLRPWMDRFEAPGTAKPASDVEEGSAEATGGHVDGSGKFCTDHVHRAFVWVSFASLRIYILLYIYGDYMHIFILYIY